MSSPDTLTDYSTEIRAQIERDVGRLGLALSYRGFAPTTVHIGYTVNSHHGQPLFKDGDEIAGLRVQIDPFRVHTIRVSDSEGLLGHVEESKW